MGRARQVPDPQLTAIESAREAVDRGRGRCGGEAGPIHALSVHLARMLAIATEQAGCGRGQRAVAHQGQLRGRKGAARDRGFNSRVGVAGRRSGRPIPRAGQRGMPSLASKLLLLCRGALTLAIAAGRQCRGGSDHGDRPSPSNHDYEKPAVSRCRVVAALGLSDDPSRGRVTGMHEAAPPRLRVRDPTAIAKSLPSSQTQADGQRRRTTRDRPELSARPSAREGRGDGPELLEDGGAAEATSRLGLALAAADDLAPCGWQRGPGAARAEPSAAIDRPIEKGRRRGEGSSFW